MVIHRSQLTSGVRPRHADRGGRHACTLTFDGVPCVPRGDVVRNGLVVSQKQPDLTTPFTVVQVDDACRTRFPRPRICTRSFRAPWVSRIAAPPRGLRCPSRRHREGGVRRWQAPSRSAARSASASAFSRPTTPRGPSDPAAVASMPRAHAAPPRGPSLPPPPPPVAR
jgi:hypothetical protein